MKVITANSNSVTCMSEYCKDIGGGRVLHRAKPILTVRECQTKRVSYLKILSQVLSKTTVILFSNLNFRELEKERAEKTVAVETRRILEAERLQRESDVTQSTARMLEMIQACTGQNQALGVTNARLRE